MTAAILERIKEAVVLGEKEEVRELTRKAVAEGVKPLSIIDEALIPGIKLVGDKFSEGEYFLPDLIVGGSTVQAAMEIVEPILRDQKQTRETLGTIVMGTVKGDIHDIGKKIVGLLLRANGFEVYDLGVSVATEDIIEKVKETNANIVGVSALLSTTLLKQKEVIELLEEAGIRDKVKVMVGGAPVTKAWAERIGADAYAHDAITAVSEAKRLVGKE